MPDDFDPRDLMFQADSCGPLDYTQPDPVPVVELSLSGGIFRAPLEAARELLDKLADHFGFHLMKHLQLEPVGEPIVEVLNTPRVIKTKLPGEPCNCGRPLERKPMAFHWRGVSRDGAFCPACNACWAITGEEIPPLQNPPHNGDSG